MNSPTAQPVSRSPSVLPAEIKFCKKCVISNTRPSGTNEYKHRTDKKHEYIAFDEEGVCWGCRFAEAKETTIDWVQREKELIELLDRHRSKDGSYDVVVPGSGGKDSCMAAHLLKYKYGMHPITVTWAPHMYTDIGWKNFQNWINVGGFDNELFTPNGKVHRLLTRNAFLNLLHPFQPFIVGQKTFPVKVAAKYGIPLIFWGENPGEYGTNISVDQKGFTSDPKENEGHRLAFIDRSNIDQIYLGGKSVAAYVKEDGIPLGEFDPYLPLDPEAVKRSGIDFQYLGYYIKWHPQGAYYYAAEHCGFQASPERTAGTYSKYNSLDDKIDDFHYFTTFIKFGIGRATYEAAQEIRNGEITREEGIALVRKFDGEFPQRFFGDFLEYIGITEEQFWTAIDSYRDPILWEKAADGWKLRHKVS
ncbi:MAG: N-acetyl sugar amidotransferase [Candidatus Peribacteraceae bacterium]|nr:N-acetyl sugar amidotransferase [Candidatus Peribacteraceae bacterium]